MFTTGRFAFAGALIIISMLLFFSCPVHAPSGPVGAVIFRVAGLDGAAASKTAYPNGNSAFYVVSQLIVQGSGPQGAISNMTFAPSGPGVFDAVIPNLLPGTWNFVIIANNAFGNRIAQTGMTNVSVTAAGMNDVAVTLVPILSGNGSFSVNIMWVPSYTPDRIDVVMDPVLPVDGAPSTSTYAVGGSGFSLGPIELAAGMYRTTFLLYSDGGAGPADWGHVESVYIAPGQNSFYSSPLLDLSEITALPDIQGPSLENGVVVPGIPLELSTSDPTAIILYSTNGTDPDVFPGTMTPMNGTVYDNYSPPDICGLGALDATVHLRARAFNRWGGSKIIYRTYDLSEAIYLQASGDPNGVGSRNDPSPTLSRAIARAMTLKAESPSLAIQLRMAKGIYVGGVGLPDGVDLLGNYTVPGWIRDISLPPGAFTVSNSTVIIPPDFGAAQGTDADPLAALRISGARTLGNYISRVSVLGPKSGSYTAALAIADASMSATIEMDSVFLDASGMAATRAMGIYISNYHLYAMNSIVRVAQSASATNSVAGVRSYDAELTLGPGTRVLVGNGGSENIGVSFECPSPRSLMIDGAEIQSGAAFFASYGVFVQNRNVQAAVTVRGGSEIRGNDVSSPSSFSMGAGLKVGFVNGLDRPFPVDLSVLNSRVYSGSTGMNQYAAYIHHPLRGTAANCVYFRESAFIARGAEADRVSIGIRLETNELDAPILIERSRIYGGDTYGASAESVGFYNSSLGAKVGDIVLRNNIVHAGSSNAGLSAAMRFSRSEGLANELYAYAIGNTMISVRPDSRALLLEGAPNLHSLDNLIVCANGGGAVNAITSDLSRAIKYFEANALVANSGYYFFLNSILDNGSLPAGNFTSTFSPMLFTGIFPYGLSDFFDPPTATYFLAELTASSMTSIREGGFDPLTFAQGTREDFDGPSTARNSPWSIGAQEY